jgi:mannose-6-phosphate isomerase-like protein (cupin superfamily)
MNNLHSETYPKTVQKPWGKEIWLQLNDRYCFKQIYINRGMRTSLHYHEKKVETNCIISGEAEIWLENEHGEIEKHLMKANDSFSVHPPQKHRMGAVTDLMFLEVSSPEVDDVIRVEDDAGRPDGRIEAEHHAQALG